MRVRIWLSFVFISLLTTGGAGAGPDPDVKKTWEKAEIWVKPEDGSVINSHMDDIRLQDRLILDGRKLSTVIFFHDCGKNRKLAGWHFARFMARAGFAVILPDSFARTERPETCTHWQFLPLAEAPLNQVHALRKAEIAEALESVRTLEWVD